MMLAWIVTGILIFIITITVYILYMSSRHNELQKLGFVGPKRYPVLGTSVGDVFKCLTEQYEEYKHNKVFATYNMRQPGITVTSLDIIKDILGTNFNQFPNHRPGFKTGSIFDETLMTLEGEQWKKVRRTVSPTFSTGKIKRMSHPFAKKTKDLVEHLKEKQESGEEVELKLQFSAFAMDAIANTVYSVDLDSIKDTDHPFVKNAKLGLDNFIISTIVFFCFPFLAPVVRVLGNPFRPKRVKEYFYKFVTDIMEDRQKDETKKQDFIQILLDSAKENKIDTEGLGDVDKELLESGGEVNDLTQEQMIGTAVTFLIAGYETISTALSFILFVIAHNPDVMKKIEDEIDKELGEEFPNYNNIQNLTYLDMCINEGLRLYPPGIVLERHCVESVDIRGVHFPQGYTTIIPLWAIHRDADIWPEPDKFDPERFSDENKASRHPCAFMPFGQGPRGCVAMRFAQVELKIALAAVLQHLTPVPCDKSVYPIVLEPMRIAALNGLWLKFEQKRKHVST